KPIDKAKRPPKKRSKRLHLQNKCAHSPAQAGLLAPYSERDLPRSGNSTIAFIFACPNRRRRSEFRIAPVRWRSSYPRAQSAASLIAVSKLFASKAGILWIRPRPWVEYQTENASIASGFGALTMSTKS